MTLGLFVSLFVSMTIAYLILIIKFKPPKATPMLIKVKSPRLLKYYETIAINQKFLVLAISTIILVLSIYGITRLKVENSFINYFDKNTEIYKGMKLNR